MKAELTAVFKFGLTVCICVYVMITCDPEMRAVSLGLFILDFFFPLCKFHL
jgi:hypothetical protein